MYDERGDLALSPFEDDLFAAIRFAFNDVAGTALLSGVVVDRETGASLINVEGSRRLGDRSRVSLELRSFVRVPRSDFMHGFSADDHLTLEVSWFF